MKDPNDEIGKTIHVIYKPLGLTPLEALLRYKAKIYIKDSEPMTYAGRLDPMAEGVLIALSGKAIKRKSEFLSLPKKYNANVLFGYSSDSYDALGMAKQTKLNTPITAELATRAAMSFQGMHKLRLPAYSSVPINGKPLFEWAQDKRLEEIEIPNRIMNIRAIEVEGFRSMQPNELLEYLHTAISKVSGDFRQKEIIEQWSNLLEKQDYPLFTVQLDIACESGTYIRSIADALGKKLGTGALLLQLKRTAVGLYEARDAIRIE